MTVSPHDQVSTFVACASAHAAAILNHPDDAAKIAASANAILTGANILMAGSEPQPCVEDEQIGSGPIEEQQRGVMNALASVLDEALNPRRTRRIGFVLMVFPFNAPGRCNYISNADRADVVTMLREQLAYFDGMPENAEGSA